MGNASFFREASKENSSIRWKDIFSESFARHSKQELERAMQVGTISRQVPESRMLSTWHRPWLWWPLTKAGLIFILLLYAAFFILWEFFDTGSVTLYQMCVIIPPLIIPLIMMIFFWELNVPQNISLLDMGAFYLVGGIISFSVTALGFLVLPSWMPACYASLREEPAKLIATLAILLYIQNVQKKRIYGLTGLAVGAAVGAAFSGLESMSYALDMYGSLGAVATNQLMRSLFAIAGHVAYCIPYSCAIALNTENGKLKATSVVCPQTLLAFAISIGLHWCWNSAGSMVILIGLCCLAPFRLIYWVRKCLQQIATICTSQTRADSAGQEIILYCNYAPIRGSCWKTGGEVLVIGREKKSCGVCLPADAPRVSRQHCRVYRSNKGWVVQDLNATYGTYVDGRRLPPGAVVSIRKGSRLQLGSDKVWFTVV